MFPARFFIISVTIAACLAVTGQARAKNGDPEEAAWQALDTGGDNAPAGQDAALPDPIGTDQAGDALPRIAREKLRPRPYGKSQPSGPVKDADQDTVAPVQASRLEDAYAARIVDRLEQFGYDQFDPQDGRDREQDRNGLPGGMAQDDFILSAGDRLAVTLRGQTNTDKTYTIDTQGRLLVPDLPPVTAAGMTLGQVRDALKAASGERPNTELFVSLDGVRQIDILIVGHVRKPGRKTLTVFNTVLDALEQAGGIEKTGSLRQVKLVRDGRSTLIDLYGLLISGSTAMDLSLRDGDRIIVPPVGSTVAIAGGVKRPGIYELPYSPRGLPGMTQAQDRMLSLQDMIALGGGLLSPGQLRYVRMNLTADGRDEVRDVADAFAPQFGDGDILSVAASSQKRTDTVELSGEVRKPGTYALSKVPLLSALLDSERVLGPDIYPLIGVIDRENGDQLARQMIVFPPLQVIRGKFDQSLQDGDIVRLFSRRQIEALKQKPPAPELGSADPDDKGPLSDPVLIGALKEHAVFVRGAVRKPGLWPVAEGTGMDSVIAASGGMTLEASPQTVEVTSTSLNEGAQKGSGGPRRGLVDLTTINPSSIILSPGDSIRVNQKFRKLEENSVLIAGQVARPGRYDLMPGDHLSDLLKRAGGVTDEAYPQGAIFSRLSERKAEEQRFRAEARNLETRLAASVQDKKDKAPSADQIGAVEQLIDQLKNAEGVGRITVEASPDALATDPAVDILLESGDRVYIPQRPLTVRVAGEVLSPASLQFRKDKDARDYIMEAGGMTYNADEGRAFVLYPDGSAQPIAVGSWSHNAVFIPPGSTVVVPRDPKPFDFLETARDVTQILSNLAVTGIFIGDIRDN